MSSLLVLPIASAMQFKKGYKWTLIIGVIIGVISMVSGLTISYYANFRPGSTIVLVAVVILLLIFLVNGIRSIIKQRR